jgi:hypothetical protein
MNKITLSIVGALAAITLTAPAARAATFGEWLAYCAGGDETIDAKIKADSMKTCSVDEGIKAACSVLSGTPWTCAMPSAKPKDKGSKCDEHDLRFEIGAGFKMPGTWTIAGRASATYTRLAIKSNINICNTTPVLPTPTGTGGGYSAESGDIQFLIEIKLSGEVTVTSPVGISVTLNAAAGCSRSTEAQYYKKAEVNACGMPTPTPASTPPATPPPASPTPGTTPPPATPPPATPPPATPPPASPTPSTTPPSTPPPASPTPGSTPPSTPPPASPTPGSTPPSTPPPTTSPTPSTTPRGTF